MPSTASPARVLTNIAALHQTALDSGLRSALACDGARGYLRQLREADLVVIDNDWGKLAIAALLRPMSGYRLVSVDIILRRPKGARDKFARWAKRRVLDRVDRFVLYFRDIAGYQVLYGIGPDRVAYVPFKVNGWEDRGNWPEPNEPGDYVLCAGRTMRDIDTFAKAMARAGCPGVLLQQDRRTLAEHGTAETGWPLPANVRRILDPTDDLSSFIGHIAGARILVIPRFRGDLAPTGISTYLNAMALGRPVIISSGPGADDVLDGEAMIVPAEDPIALGGAIARLWSDARTRKSLGAKGRAYAVQRAGEMRLQGDILAASLEALALQAGTAEKFSPASR